LNENLVRKLPQSSSPTRAGPDRLDLSLSITDFNAAIYSLLYGGSRTVEKG
jgi:hypothetical protein